MSTLSDCPTCADYAKDRLPTVLRLWWTETGRRVWVGTYLAGVHARHEAGLSLDWAAR